MPPQLSLAHRTMFAELVQRCMDASFDEQFSERGRFYQATVKGRGYWYYEAARSDPASSKRLYVGPVDDPAITGRVEHFKSIKADYGERRGMVRSLLAVGLPRPLPLVADVTMALEKAGLFRQRGVLIGTTAFQCYGGYLGIRLPHASITTGDADFAQFHDISIAVEDSMPAMVTTLKAVDPSFETIPGLDPKAPPAKLQNAGRFMVEFLTPNRGSDDHEARPAKMPALGGIGAQPLRFLDFLIREPVRSVMLHAGGVPVSIPSPQRYAVHKLIVAVRRRDDANGRQKSAKDIVQSGLLLAALHQERRLSDVGEAFLEAWDRGPDWRDTLARGRARLAAGERELLDIAITEACRLLRHEQPDLGP